MLRSGRDFLGCGLRRNFFLSWLSSSARGLFFFFVVPRRAIWDLLSLILEDFQAANYEIQASNNGRSGCSQPSVRQPIRP